jgi:hypothetical protein
MLVSIQKGSSSESLLRKLAITLTFISKALGVGTYGCVK